MGASGVEESQIYVMTHYYIITQNLYRNLLESLMCYLSLDECFSNFTVLRNAPESLVKCCFLGTNGKNLIQ